MYEAELKFRINKDNIPALEEKLRSFNPISILRFTYVDSYFDDPNNSLYLSEKELRIRKKYATRTSGPDIFLTFKDTPFDSSSGSKPEYEISVDDGDTLEEILELLGFNKRGSFSKHCIHYTLTYEPYEISATLVGLDEVKDLFLELEIPVGSLDDTPGALRFLHHFARLLGISEVNFTRDYYTDIILGLNK